MAKIPWAKRYAHGTESKPTNTRAEIEAVISRFGATKFALGIDGHRADVMFEYAGRRVRFSMPDAREALAPYGYGWNERDVEAEHRRLWRSLLMTIKAKLEIVASGISTFEVEFLPYTMIDARRTFAEAAAEPGFAMALEAGMLPPMLTGGSK